MATLSPNLGVIERIHHPLVYVHGLRQSFIGEVVKFEQDGLGQVTSVDVDAVEVMVFSPIPLRVGMEVRGTGELFQVVATPHVLGQVVSPLGTIKPADHPHNEQRAVDTMPAPLIQRRRVNQTLRTGVSVSDLMLPLGKGQRELLAGDRKTGKTTFIQHLIQAQVEAGALIVVAAIGKRLSEIQRLVDFLAEHSLTDKVVIVASAASDPPSVIFQTPFTAMTYAEFFKDHGLDVVVILDDLTTHARFYREIALLGKRFPGRDSYPGDIFYTHARLLERAGCFVHPTEPQKTVSISCLPVAETTDSELTSHVVSNLISITDGHLLFDATLYSRGYRPAIHTGLSVTRVGKQTQTALARELTHTLNTFMTLFEKTKTLTHFGAELNEESRLLIQRGDALLAFLEQPHGLNVPPTVMTLFSLMVLSDWLAKEEAKTVRLWRDNLIKHYTQAAKVRKELDAVIEAAKSVADLTTSLQANQTRILELCQA